MNILEEFDLPSIENEHVIIEIEMEQQNKNVDFEYPLFSCTISTSKDPENKKKIKGLPKFRAEIDHLSQIRCINKTIYCFQLEWDHQESDLIKPRGYVDIPIQIKHEGLFDFYVKSIIHGQKSYLASAGLSTMIDTSDKDEKIFQNTIEFIYQEYQHKTEGRIGKLNNIVCLNWDSEKILEPLEFHHHGSNILTLVMHNRSNSRQKLVYGFCDANENILPYYHISNGFRFRNPRCVQLLSIFPGESQGVMIDSEDPIQLFFTTQEDVNQGSFPIKIATKIIHTGVEKESLSKKIKYISSKVFGDMYKVPLWKKMSQTEEFDYYLGKSLQIEYLEKLNSNYYPNLPIIKDGLFNQYQILWTTLNNKEFSDVSQNRDILLIDAWNQKDVDSWMNHYQVDPHFKPDEKSSFFISVRSNDKILFDLFESNVTIQSIQQSSKRAFQTVSLSLQEGSYEVRDLCSMITQQLEKTVFYLGKNRSFLSDLIAIDWNFYPYQESSVIVSSIMIQLLNRSNYQIRVRGHYSVLSILGKPFYYGSKQNQQLNKATSFDQMMVRSELLFVNHQGKIIPMEDQYSYLLLSPLNGKFKGLLQQGPQIQIQVEKNQSYCFVVSHTKPDSISFLTTGNEFYVSNILNNAYCEPKLNNPCSLYGNPCIGIPPSQSMHLFIKNSHDHFRIGPSYLPDQDHFHYCRFTCLREQTETI